MIPGPIRLFNPTGPDRVAVLAAEPAGAGAATFLVRLARGPRSGKLGKGSVYGPMAPAEVATHFEILLAQLRAEGFGPAGVAGLLADLKSPQAVVRARAAARLGWLRSAEAVAPILAALPTAVDDVCALLDALGAIGDPRAIPLVRDYATRKLLSRRRSAVEALRNLGDAAGLADAIARARGSLPASVLAAVDAIGPADDPGAAGAPIATAVRGLEAKFQGLALDILYEIGTPAAVAAVRTVLDEDFPFGRAFSWRYVKSLYKRALLRSDLESFARLSRAIEIQARGDEGGKAPVKSGYDGVERQTPIFRRPTQDHLRRLGWRYMRNLAAYRPHLYAHAAAEVFVAYRPTDAEEPHRSRGPWARCYLLHRVLYGASKRFRLDGRRLTWHHAVAGAIEPPAPGREVAHPALWDAEPTAHLRILAGSGLVEAHRFGCEQVAGPHRRVLEAASTAVVVALLRASHEPTVRLGLGELDRRFDPAAPDYSLLDQLLLHDLPAAKQLGRRWLRESAPRWALDPEWIGAFLCFPDGETAALAAGLALPALAARPDLRRALAARLLHLLRVPEVGAGTHDVYARVARSALAVEVGALLTLADLIGMITTGSPPVQALAGALLAGRPEALDVLGLEGLVVLAEHEVALVRGAAQGLIRSEPERFWAQPAPLFLLVESGWPDTRELAFDILRDAVSLDTLGPDGLLGLLDSNRTDVQDMGRELVRKHRDRLDLRFFATRLIEHPHPNVRRFALDLAVEHWPAGPLALARLEPFCRAVILALRPDRLLKRRVIDFLLRQGKHDLESAEVAVRLLAEFVRLDVRADSEHALEAIVRLNLAYPGINSAVAVGLGGVA